jgi:ADP-heptose:LPS heptosyltransferase
MRYHHNDDRCERRALDLPRGATPKRPLCLGYYAQNPVLAATLLAWDALCRLLPRQRDRPVREIRRVLIANWAHLGDVVLASSLVSLLRACRPDVQVGFLAGSWGRPAVENLSGIRWLHTVDHWRLSRHRMSLRRKLSLYFADRHRALGEIQSVGYDAAIDTYHCFPNSASLLWQAGIPRRVGYRSGGGGPLFTDALSWIPANRHITSYHRDLLKALLGPNSFIPLPAMPEIQRRVTAIAGLDFPYAVMHMGAGTPLKEWPEWKWIQLAAELTNDGNRIVFTGRGEREAAAAKRVCQSLGSGIDLCDRLEWSQWVELIRGAKLLIGLDSVAGHVAAATHTPSVVIYTGMANDAQWKPLTAHCETLRYPTSCAPCYRSRGCSSMACVREVAVRQVLESCRRVLSSGEPHS